MDIARTVVTVRVGADERRMSWKVFLAELQAQRLRFFQGQTVVSCVPGVKADDVVMRFDITRLCVFAVLPVRQQAGHGEGVFPTFQRIQQILLAELGLAMFVQNGQAGVLVVLEGEVAFRRREVRVLRACMLDGCHTVHRSLSRHPAGRK